MPPSVHLTNKLFVYKALSALAEATPATLEKRLSEAYHSDAAWRGSHPMNEMQGIDAIASKVWGPLLASFPDLERRDLIVIGGHSHDTDKVATICHYCGTFRHDWLGIPATGKTIYLRSGEVHVIKDGKIAQSTVLIDVLDVIRQAGFWPVAPSLGREGRWPGPLTADGLVFREHDPAEGAASIAQTLAMHQALGGYNDEALAGREGLLNMPQKEHWHPKMMWYGPSGIGTTRGLSGFVDQHQLPFRLAFPNRRDGQLYRTGGHHYIRVGDGPYSVTGGWPSVRAKHLGGGFMGVGPTGRDINMRVMDFYLHHEGLIRENWVPIDIINVLLQMDVDVLDRLHNLCGTRR